MESGSGCGLEAHISLLPFPAEVILGQAQRGLRQGPHLRSELSHGHTHPSSDGWQRQEGGDVWGGAGMSQRPQIVHVSVYRSIQTKQSFVAGLWPPHRRSWLRVGGEGNVLPHPPSIPTSPSLSSFLPSPFLLPSSLFLLLLSSSLLSLLLSLLTPMISFEIQSKSKPTNNRFNLVQRIFRFH